MLLYHFVVLRETIGKSTSSPLCVPACWRREINLAHRMVSILMWYQLAARRSFVQDFSLTTLHGCVDFEVV